MYENYDDNILNNHQKQIEKLKAQMNVYVQHKKVMDELIQKGDKNGKNRKEKIKNTGKN